MAGGVMMIVAGLLQKKVTQYQDWITLVVVVIVVGALLYRFRDWSISHIAKLWKRKPEERLPLKKIAAQFSTFWDGSHHNLKKEIKARLNDPGSFTHVKTIYWDMKTHLMVRTTFRAKNGFGGTVTHYAKAKFDLNGRLQGAVEVQ